MPLESNIKTVSNWERKYSPIKKTKKLRAEELVDTRGLTPSQLRIIQSKINAAYKKVGL